MRNEKVAALDAMYQDIVADVAAHKSAGGKTGRMTNQLLTLAEKSKAAVNQPIATQKILLNELMDTYNKAQKEWSKISQIKDMNNGRYPTDVQEQLINSYQEGEQEGRQEKFAGNFRYSSDGRTQKWNDKLKTYQDA